MQIQRTRHDRAFIVLPNYIVQDPSLSLTARGLLGLLLSQPDHTAETVKSLTEDAPEGQQRVTGAMRELQAAGYVRCDKAQNDRGHWSTHVTVSDVPMTEEPKNEDPQAGGQECRSFGPNPMGKNREKNPPVPTPVDEAEAAPAAEVEGGQGDGHQEQDQTTAEAVAVLTGVGRVERRLRLGVPEMLKLAPLAVEWLSRGATEAEIRDALISGLPAKIRSASHVIEWRLTHKIPPVPAPVEPVVPLAECGQCRGPLPRGQEAGICGPCAGVAPRNVAPADSLDWRHSRTRPGLVSPSAGRARVRAALGF
ncbi:hypothetical protein ABZW10_28510 [Kitasatospora sp. NPDC004723]|uniref:hypothetical protein n=1 Tax=Kitasatospora sp. NPDC004723 TaxID=3154288 RepID=UPI0033BF023F